MAAQTSRTVVPVTGSARGLGNAIASRLARHAHNIALNDHSGERRVFLGNGRKMHSLNHVDGGPEANGYLCRALGLPGKQDT